MFCVYITAGFRWYGMRPNYVRKLVVVLFEETENSQSLYSVRQRCLTVNPTVVPLYRAFHPLPSQNRALRVRAPLERCSDSGLD